MSVSQSQLPDRLLNKDGENLPAHKQQYITNDIQQTLFFVRMTRLVLVTLLDSKFLAPDLRKSVVDVHEILKRFDMKVRERSSTEKNKQLSHELSKPDKLASMINITLYAAKISNAGFEPSKPELILDWTEQILCRTHFIQQKKIPNSTAYITQLLHLVEQELGNLEHGRPLRFSMTEDDELVINLITSKTPDNGQTV